MSNFVIKSIIFIMDISFCNLRNKEVINVCDGKKLGNIVDLVFDTCYGKVTGIVIPADRSILNVFKTCNDIFIPYNKICKIGKDIILVELTPQQNNNINICQDESNMPHSVNIKNYDMNNS